MKITLHGTGNIHIRPEITVGGMHFGLWDYRNQRPCWRCCPQGENWSDWMSKRAMMGLIEEKMNVDTPPSEKGHSGRKARA